MWKRFSSLTTLALLAVLVTGVALIGSGKGLQVAQFVRGLLKPPPAVVGPAPLPAIAAVKPVTGIQPQELIRRASATLDSYGSIVAKIRQRGTFFGVSMIGSGNYLQGPSASHRLRLELTLQLGDAKGSFQQIADGQSLWIRREFVTETQLGRVDIDGVLENQEQRPGDKWLRNGFVLGLGGLPALFYGLEQSFDFDTIAETRLANTPVYVLRGLWQPQALAVLLPEQKDRITAGETVDLTKLPDHVPDEVLIFLGRDDLFPYRFEFRRTSAAQPKRHNGQPAPTQTFMAAEFFEVQVNQELGPNLFAFDPGEADVIDLTGVFLSHRSKWHR